ncbi:unnamed protein product [Lota lota]
MSHKITGGQDGAPTTGADSNDACVCLDTIVSALHWAKWPTCIRSPGPWEEHVTSSPAPEQREGSRGLTGGCDALVGESLPNPLGGEEPFCGRREGRGGGGGGGWAVRAEPGGISERRRQQDTGDVAYVNAFPLSGL